MTQEEHTARSAQGASPTARPEARVVLMLQGAASRFHGALGKALAQQGAEVLKINLCAAEWAFWPGRARSYRGRPEDWPSHIQRQMRDLGVTDLVLFGDCRFYHAEAIKAARPLGIRLHLFEEGYLRPNWITLEHFGVNAHSDLPCDPEAIRAEAERLGPAPEPLPFRDRFALRALWDVAWNTNLLAGWPLYPHYRRHTVIHPIVEYAGWLRQFARTGAMGRHDAAARAALTASGAAYYVLPLQLDGDFQIRVHSDFRDMGEATEMVFASFARSAPPDSRLLVKRHPFDVTLHDRQREILTLAARHGLAERLTFIETGDIQPLIAGSAGVLVVNSTSAGIALEAGIPVKVLGRATYDIPGLAFQGPLDAFWTGATAPDAALWQAYRRVVIARTQVNGGFFSHDGIAHAVAESVRRIWSTPAPKRRAESSEPLGGTQP